MSRNWLRKCTVTFSSSGNSTTLDVSEMRCRFRIRRVIMQTICTMDLVITNLSEATATKLAKQEFDRVELSGGYQDNSGLLFRGNVLQVRKGKENPTDTYVAILAADADAWYSFGTVSKTFAAGSTQRDHLEEAMRSYADTVNGVKIGHVGIDLDSPRYPRAVTLFGNARDVVRNVALTNGATWWVADQQLHIMPTKMAIPGSAIVLNSLTGLIGLPTQTLDGIEARSLINPQIKLGGLVRIDQKSIQQMQLPVNLGGLKVDPTVAAQLPSISADGFYKCIRMEVSGDTRGESWFMDLICISTTNTSVLNDENLAAQLAIDRAQGRSENPFIGTQ